MNCGGAQIANASAIASWVKKKRGSPKTEHLRESVAAFSYERHINRHCASSEIGPALTTHHRNSNLPPRAKNINYLLGDSMKNLILFALFIAMALPAEARVRNVVNCNNGYVSVKIDTSGEFGSNEYNVVIEDIKTGEQFPWVATLKGTSFVSEGNPTINTNANRSIAFVKGGWGLTVIEGADCDMHLD